MKTLESIREETWEEMLRLEDKRIDQWVDIRYQTLREVLQKLGHLDEPEVLSQEWIDEHLFSPGDKYPWKGAVPVVDLQNILVPKQEEITHKQVEKYLLDKNIRVIDIDVYEKMQSELEELKNGTTLSKTETVADVIADFFKSLERLKEVMSMEVEEWEE